MPLPAPISAKHVGTGYGVDDLTAAELAPLVTLAIKLFDAIVLILGERVAAFLALHEGDELLVDGLDAGLHLLRLLALGVLLVALTVQAPASQAQTDPLRYVALGDSYVAAPLVPITDVANGCFRSSNNYPAIVAKKLGAKLDDRSCGGATTAHILSPWAELAPQVDAVTADTRLVTITIGGNDVNFAGVMTDCVLYGTSTCVSEVNTAENTARTSAVPSWISSNSGLSRPRSAASISSIAW